MHLKSERLDCSTKWNTAFATVARLQLKYERLDKGSTEWNTPFATTARLQLKYERLDKGSTEWNTAFATTARLQLKYEHLDMVGYFSGRTQSCHALFYTVCDIIWACVNVPNNYILLTTLLWLTVPAKWWVSYTSYRSLNLASELHDIIQGSVV